MRIARLLVKPRWLLRHLLVIGLCIAFFFLSRWQWHRGEASSGTVQNYGYAVEWLVFGGCVCFAWWKLLSDELYPDGKPGKKKRAPRVSPWRVPSAATPATTATAVPAAAAASAPLVPAQATAADAWSAVSSSPAGSSTGVAVADRAVTTRSEPVIDVLTGKPMTTAEIEADDTEVLAYNAYLAQLAAKPVNGYRAKSPIPGYRR